MFSLLKGLITMKAATRKGRILVMDDDEFMRELLLNALSISGYEVCLSGHGDEAIELYLSAKKTKQPFHALILDLKIKNGMDGVETIGRLTSIDPDVKAIVCSGQVNHPAMHDPADFGFSGVLSKPFSFEQLRNEVGKVIGERSARLY
jgi:DNA-binding NtrC family response regulator